MKFASEDKKEREINTKMSPTSESNRYLGYYKGTFPYLFYLVAVL
jgi:hypothetical protein